MVETFKKRADIVLQHTGKTFRFTDHNTQVVIDMIKYANGYQGILDPGKGIILLGEKGLGKTTLLLTMRQCYPAKYQFPVWGSEEMGHLYEQMGSEAFARLKRTCMINDILREKDQYAHFAEPLNVIQFVIDRMYEEWQYHGNLMHGTGNGNLDLIKKKYGERTHDCLIEMSNIIWLEGDNLRLTS